LFFSLQDTKTPMYSGVIGVAVNICLSLWLSRIMGIGGLTLATSISVTLKSMLLLVFLRRKTDQLGFGETAKDILKMAVCAVPCLIVVFTIRYYTADFHVLFRFGLTTIAAGIVYLAAAFLVKEIVVYEILDLVRKKLKLG